jgi:hypothetical protein
MHTSSGAARRLELSLLGSLLLVTGCTGSESQSADGRVSDGKPSKDTSVARDSGDSTARLDVLSRRDTRPLGSDGALSDQRAIDRLSTDRPRFDQRKIDRLGFDLPRTDLLRTDLPRHDRPPPTDGITSGRRRMPIYVTNSGAPLADYQLKIDVPFSCHMKADFSDVKFTFGDGTTSLTYWKESHTASSSAVFWVKDPQLPSGSSTIYMYYGDPAAADASDGPATFEFFDDFSGTALDAAKWVSGTDGTSTVTVSNGYLRIESPYDGSKKVWAYASSDRQLAFPMTIETRARLSAGSCCHGFVSTGLNQELTYDAPSITNVAQIGNSVAYTFNVNGTAVTTAPITSDTWTRFTVKLASGASSCTFNSVTHSNPAVFYESSNFLKLHVRKWYPADAVYDWDWVALRKYATTEPGISLGAEEVITP